MVSKADTLTNKRALVIEFPLIGLSPATFELSARHRFEKMIDSHLPYWAAVDGGSYGRGYMDICIFYSGSDASLRREKLIAIVQRVLGPVVSWKIKQNGVCLAKSAEPDEQNASIGDAPAFHPKHRQKYWKIIVKQNIDGDLQFFTISSKRYDESSQWDWLDVFSGNCHRYKAHATSRMIIIERSFRDQESSTRRLPDHD
jgi:hypothetical protein